MVSVLGFRHIEAVRAVLLTGSVTAAAEHLHVTQPAVSNTLRDAETRLGFRLFERRAGCLLPNAAAAQLFEEIERSFRGLDEVNQAARRVGQGEGRRIVVAATPAFGASTLPGVLRGFRASSPGTLLAVESRNANLVASMVATQKADIGFAPEVPAIRGLSSELVAKLPMVCYLPANHPLAQGAGPLKAAQLIHEPMISPGQLERMDQLVAAVFRNCGAMPSTVAECPVILTACAMVAAGIGFTITNPLPSWLLPRDQVVTRAIEPVVYMNYCAYWVGSRLPMADRELLVGLARQEISALAEVPQQSG
jgi:DNA-binding transcriptional LysR family regulator